MTTDDGRAEAWQGHYKAWRHCLRCKNADWRCHHDPDINKRATPTPMAGSLKTYTNWRKPKIVNQFPVVLLLPFPDSVQSYYASPVGNVKDNKEEWSPQLHALVSVWGDLEGKLPYDLAEIPIVFALGCRPVNWRRTRDVVGPSQTILSSCRRRWQEQLLMIDPALVISFGHWGHATLFPNEMKKGDYSDSLGEVKTFSIPSPKGSVSYPAYIAYDPYVVADRARNDQWTRPFSALPTSSSAKHPVEALRWDIWRACWLGKVLELSSHGEFTLPSVDEGLDEWVSMVTALNDFYDGRDHVTDAVSQVEGYVDYLTKVETSPQNVRLAQLGEIPAERPKTHIFNKIGAHRKRSMNADMEDFDDGDSTSPSTQS